MQRIDDPPMHHVSLFAPELSLREVLDWAADYLEHNIPNGTFATVKQSTFNDTVFWFNWMTPEEVALIKIRFE